MNTMISAVPVVLKSAATCGLSVSISGIFSPLVLRRNLRAGGAPAGVRVRAEIGLAAPPVADVGVELGRRQVGMAQEFLHRAEVGAALQQVRGEGVPEQVGVDAWRL